METIMRIKLIGAAAAVAIMASGLAMAQQTQPSAPPTGQISTEAPSAATTPPSLIPPGPTPAEQTDATTGKTKATHRVAHNGGACQQAIKVSEKALEKSQASPDTIAQAWQHIENAKQEKGQACKDEAKQAREML